MARAGQPGPRDPEGAGDIAPTPPLDGRHILQHRCCKAPSALREIPAGGGDVRFTVRLYYLDNEQQERPVLTFLETLRRQGPVLHKLLVAGLKKIEQRERRGPPLTAMVD